MLNIKDIELIENNQFNEYKMVKKSLLQREEFLRIYSIKHEYRNNLALNYILCLLNKIDDEILLFIYIKKETANIFIILIKEKYFGHFIYFD